MKKYIILGLLLIAFSACAPIRRTVKTESTSRSRDSIRIEQVRSDFTHSIKTLSDNSRIRIVYYRPERDSVTGEQLIEREEIRENKIVAKDSIAQMESKHTNVLASSVLEKERKEEITEKRGLNCVQQLLMWVGIGVMLFVLGIITYRLRLMLIH